MPGTRIIRPATEADAAAIAAIYAPHVTEGVASFELLAPDAAEMRSRLASVTVKYPWLVCERDGVVAGYAYANVHNARAAYGWSTNVTVYVDSNCHRCGVGRALYMALFELLRLQGYYRAIAGITLPNAGSVGLHEAMGFTLVGVYREVGFKAGRWHDVGWWQLALQPTFPRPAPPKAPYAVLATAAGRNALQNGAALVRG